MQPALNFVAVDRYEKARQEARAATEALAHGKATGPLHGIPITIKDNLATAGDPLTNGSHAFADVVAQADVTLAARLRAAGAIVVAKTTLPELGHKMLTDSPKYGITRNPWSLAHTPGGSSGGARAAVAAGVGAPSVGTESGGSDRCPAACARILGVKATPGRIPAQFFAQTFAEFRFSGPVWPGCEELFVMLSVIS
ncbi:MAG: amidase, partial [Alphaproteobacteria bacterium]|nr:amidase [Alphaproteobacteria bacterium]